MEDQLNNASIHGHSDFLFDLFDIKGVVDARIVGSDIHLYKEGRSKWKDIIPEVITLMKECFASVGYISNIDTPNLKSAFA